MHRAAVEPLPGHDGVAVPPAATAGWSSRPRRPRGRGAGEGGAARGRQRRLDAPRAVLAVHPGAGHRARGQRREGGCMAGDAAVAAVPAAPKGVAIAFTASGPGAVTSASSVHAATARPCASIATAGSIPVAFAPGSDCGVPVAANALPSARSFVCTRYRPLRPGCSTPRRRARPARRRPLPPPTCPPGRPRRWCRRRSGSRRSCRSRRCGSRPSGRRCRSGPPRRSRPPSRRSRPRSPDGWRARPRSRASASPRSLRHRPGAAPRRRCSARSTPPTRRSRCPRHPWRPGASAPRRAGTRDRTCRPAGGAPPRPTPESRAPGRDGGAVGRDGDRHRGLLRRLGGERERRQPRRRRDGRRGRQQSTCAEHDQEGRAPHHARTLAGTAANSPVSSVSRTSAACSSRPAGRGPCQPDPSSA